MKPLARFAFIAGAALLFTIGQVTARLSAQAPNGADQVVPAGPRQVEEIVELRGEGDEPRRNEVCTTTCAVSGDTSTTTTVCRPFVDPSPDGPTPIAATVQSAPAAAVQRTAMATPADRFRRTANGRITLLSSVAPACRPLVLMTSMSRTVEPRSPYCWVSAQAYCRYRPSGRVGYPCNCGNRAGYFD